MKESKKISINESGNGSLEMLLFIPLAFLFLFGATDVGLHLRERSVINDAIRSISHNVNNISNSTGLIRINELTEKELNYTKASELMDSISIKLSNSISKFKNDNNYSIRTALLEIDIDPINGKVKDYHIIYTPQQIGSYSLETNIPTYPYISMKQYLEEQFNSKYQNFAISSGIAYSVNSRNYNQIFNKKSYVIYASVEAESNGIGPSIVSSVLGRGLGIQSQTIAVFRNRLL